MTESEQLKKQADEAKAKQIVDKMSAYLDVLTEKIYYWSKHHSISSIVYLIVWVGWIVSDFVLNLEIAFTIFFIIALVYDSFTFTKKQEAMGELRGAIKTLRILGYISSESDKGETSKKQSVWKKGAEMVRGWVAKKKKSQEETFVPA